MWQKSLTFERKTGNIEKCHFGRLAQLVERLPYTQDVGGSSPSSSTIENEETELF